MAVGCVNRLCFHLNDARMTQLLAGPATTNDIMDRT